MLVAVSDPWNAVAEPWQAYIIGAHRKPNLSLQHCYFKNWVQGGALLLAYLAFIQEYYFTLVLISHMTYDHAFAVQFHVATVRSL